MKKYFDMTPPTEFIRKQQFQHAKQARDNRQALHENLHTAMVLGLQNNLFTVWLWMWVDLVKKGVNKEPDIPILGRERIYTRFVLELTKRVLAKSELK